MCNTIEKLYSEPGRRFCHLFNGMTSSYDKSKTTYTYIIYLTCELHPMRNSSRAIYNDSVRKVFLMPVPPTLHWCFFRILTTYLLTRNSRHADLQSTTTHSPDKCICWCG